MKTPKKSWRVRPLTDQARGALFNILATQIADSSFLDLFAGTGAVGIEALSRGARVAFFVELNRSAVALIRENLELTGLADRAEVFAMDVLRAVKLLDGKGAKFDIIYLGAPYDDPVLDESIKTIAGLKLLAQGGLLIAEYRRQQVIPEKYGELTRFREARYGETVLGFYKL
ncbi:MAG: 16S rRNA (guanine(966)-N(2))-methyltransferase RsmD [Candidatus Margulisbacteria bacterium]|nr:16S rRNA (guanine(966)-N(2))-methyltransferase RsmD [Candidatus Margulisiibacteriota bacterium]